MFERYTEKARRLIFFACYEASVFGSPYIETEHLLLGALREDKVFANRLTDAQSIRGEIEAESQKREHISTSVDLPLTHELKRALAYGAEEAKRFGHSLIDTGHLMLGLLRVEGCRAAVLLRQHGMDLEKLRKIMEAASPQSQPPPKPASFRRERAVERPSIVPEETGPAAPSLQTAIHALEESVDQIIHFADTSSESYGRQHLKRKPWSRLEALGHLIDLASAHQQWLARALTEPSLAVSGYPEDEWAAAQGYNDFSWPELLDLWVGLNRLLVHVLRLIPEEKVSMRCRIGIEPPTTLLALVSRYLEECQDVVGQILSKLE